MCQFWSFDFHLFPDGLIHIAGLVFDFMEFVIVFSLWTSTYHQTLICTISLHQLFDGTLFLVGCRFDKIPIFTGIAFSQKTQKCTKMSIMIFEILLKGNIDIQALHLSLTTLILLSTFATCPEAAFVLIATSGICGVTLLNSISMRLVWIVNPALEYKVIILGYMLTDILFD